MSYASRPITPHIRASSVGGAGSLNASGQNPALLQRIEEKKQELASLKDLQNLSGGVADQMEALETKLSTLSDGTEAIAAVLSNWHNVLRAIQLASTKIPKPKEPEPEEGEEAAKKEELPVTLVRIPANQAGAIPGATTSRPSD